MSHSSTDIMLNFKEVIALIIKEKGIHEGLFVPAMELSFGAGAEKNDSGTTAPTVKISIKNIGIQKVDDSQINNELVVDASVVNPKRKRKAKTDAE